MAEFPSPSETFIADEIEGVREAGAEMTVFALRRGAGGAELEAPVVYGPTLHAKRPAVLRSAGKLIAEAAFVEGGWGRGLLRGVRVLGTVGGFAAEVRRRRISHLHAHFASLPTTVALMVGRIAPSVGISFSAHARDIFVEGGNLAAKLSRARLCITCTAGNARHLKSLARPADRDKIVHVYHGVNLDRFRFAGRRRPSTPPLVVAAGRFVPKKGFPCLLHACARLKESMDLRCEIAGDGPLAGVLRALVSELGLADIVSFPGWIPARSMPEFYRRADVVAVPSVRAPDGDRDGLPNVVVEAAASGTPVVGSDFAGIPEAIEHGQTGLLHIPGDPAMLAAAIQRILTDAHLRSQAIENGRALVEARFDCRKNARRVCEALAAASG